MKKLLSPLHALVALLSLTLISCSDKPHAATHEAQEEHDHENEHGPENGAQFKKGQGVTLTAEMKQAIGLKTTEVTDATVPALCVVTLQIVPSQDLQPAALTPDAATSTLATGWLTAAQAEWIKSGQQVTLSAESDDAKSSTGAISRIEQTAHATLGDFALTVTTAAPLPVGTRLLMTCRAAPGAAVTSIPRSALLKTAEGTFAYTINGPSYLRTPVKTGAMNEDLVEITDGLYAGDQIVTTPVMQLWLAELQVLRGGKSCTCGH
jgi:multidrug efflux pump subunit AcrA (membrane-fusion protein)